MPLFFLPPSETQGSEGAMNEMAFCSPMMGSAWLDEVLSPSSPCHSLAAGRSEGCFALSPPRRPVIFPRSGQQHPVKPPWELLQAAQRIDAIYYLFPQFGKNAVNW